MNLHLTLNNKLKSLLILFFSLSLGTSSVLFSQEKFRKYPPPPEPLPQLNLPEIESAVLTNGLSVSVIRRENFPLIYIRLIILAGESSSPSHLPGLASFTTRMLDKGTSNLSSSEIEERIEAIGGEFYTSTNVDYSAITFSFLEEYLDQALQLLSYMILNPTFNKKEIDNLKRNFTYELRDKTFNPQFISKRILYEILFRGHPYQNETFTKESISKITQEDVLNFYKDYYCPNNAKILLVGNLSLSTGTRKVSHYLNTWRKKKVENSSLPLPESNKKLKICFVNVPQVEAPIILMGNVIPSIDQSDFFPIKVFSQVLGGTPTSRLFMNLRETKGYAFYSFSQLEFFETCEVFLIESRVRPEVIYDSVQLILDEIDRITSKKIPSEEIEQAKSYLIGNFPLTIEDYQNLSLKASQILAYKLTSDYWKSYYDKIMLIDAEDVFQTVKKYPLLTPVVVIVGEKERVFSHLSQFEEIYVYDTQGNFNSSLSKKNNNESR